MTRGRGSRPAAAAAVALVLITGCSGPSPTSDPSPGPTPHESAAVGGPADGAGAPSATARERQGVTPAPTPGAEPTGSPQPTTPTGSTSPASPTTPSGSTTTVTVGELVFTVEVADDAATRRRGLSGRASLAAGTGMLFRFAEAAIRTFWMPDMAFSLDIAWIADGAVVGVDTMTPCVEDDPADCERWTSPGPVDAALEVPAGALDAVVPGTRVDLTGVEPGPS